MVELTPEDREQIQNQITEYKENPVTVPTATSIIAPNGQTIDEDLEQVLNEGATPDKREEKKIRKRVKGIWRRWRMTVLDAKALEEEKIACQIEIERAETQAKLNVIRRKEIEDAHAHWLKLNKGNLIDIDANTESKPNLFWYALRRGFHHITKLTNNVPKIIKNFFWIGAIVLGLVLLKQFNVL